MGLKVDTIQNPSSATVNLTLDASGNVAVGANLAVTGTTTLTGGVTQTGSSTAASFIPSGSSVPTNGVFLPSANTVAFATNSTNQVSISSTGIVTGTAGNLMLVQGTSQASTSGTSITFTGIPSWAKRITVSFNGVSTSGTSVKQVQLGSGSLTTTGYTSSTTTTGTTSATLTSTTGLSFGSNIASDSVFGVMTITNVSGNIWVCSHSSYANSTPQSTFGGGGVTLSGVLDRLAITTVNGTDTFDAGSINIQYE